MIRLLAGCLIVPLMIASPAIAANPAPAFVPADGVEVAVEPFARLGDSNVPVWVGPAVQQNLIADLARLHFRPKAIEEKSPTSQPAGAQPAYVVRGSYQVTGDAIRFDGQILATADNRVVGGITATGPVRDLFGLEDAVSGQAIHDLRRLTAPQELPAPPTAQVLATAVQPPSAAPTALDGYDGSVLQAYVNANTAPSNDYADQVNASRIRQTYANDYSTNFYAAGGLGGLGAYYGTSFYPFGFGTLGYGGFGGFGGGRYGNAGLGRGIYFGTGGNFGYGFGGGGAAFHGGGFVR